MSAFLDALIARVAGGPHLVQPRPASRFEPADPAGQGPPAITEEWVAPAAALTTGIAEPAPAWRDFGTGSADSGPPAPGDGKQALARAQPVTTEGHERRPSPQIPGEAPRRVRGEPEVASMGAPEPKVQTPNLSRRQPRLEPPPPGAVAAHEHASNRPAPPIRPSGDRPGIAPSTLASAPQRAQRRASAAKVVPPLRDPGTARSAAAGRTARGSDPPYAGAEPPVPRAIARPHARAVLRSSTVVEPVRTGTPSVEITIGRIEVRAVSAPATAARAPKSAPRPTLSLDEYLAQRDGRSR